jgi:hypothetical protein
MFDDTARNFALYRAEYRRRQRIFKSSLPLWIVENLLREP